MKIFFYKSIIVFVLFILGIHFSFGLIKKNIKVEINNFFSKENIDYFKNKTREEIRGSLNKKNIMNENDAKLLNLFLKKLTSELERSK